MNPPQPRLHPECISPGQPSNINLPGAENLSREFQDELAALGLDIVVVQFDSGTESPFWNQPDTAAPLAFELSGERPAQFDSAMTTSGGYFCFYHASDLAKALHAIKEALEARGLLRHARIFHIESEAGLRCYWPPTAELVVIEK